MQRWPATPTLRTFVRRAALETPALPATPETKAPTNVLRGIPNGFTGPELSQPGQPVEIVRAPPSRRPRTGDVSRCSLTSSFTGLESAVLVPFVRGHRFHVARTSLTFGSSPCAASVHRTLRRDASDVWLVELEVRSSDGGPLVSQLLVHPRQDDHRAGFRPKLPDRVTFRDVERLAQRKRWSGRSVDVPAGGLPARLMRAFNVGELLDKAQREAKRRVNSGRPWRVCLATETLNSPPTFVEPSCSATSRRGCSRRTTGTQSARPSGATSITSTPLRRQLN